MIRGILTKCDSLKKKTAVFFGMHHIQSSARLAFGRADIPQAARVMPPRDEPQQ